jgi:hypothetical protein
MGFHPSVKELFFKHCAFLAMYHLAKLLFHKAFAKAFY